MRIGTRISFFLVLFVPPTLGLGAPAPAHAPATGQEKEAAPRFSADPRPHAVFRAYLDTVREFRGGDAARAKLSLLRRDRAWWSEAINDMRAAIKNGAVPARDVEAAGVLHVELALEGTRPWQDRVFHQDTARQLLILDGARVSRTLQKLWYLAFVAYWQREAQVDEVMAVVAEAKTRFPDDPQVLLAQASLWELLASWPGSEGLQLRPNAAIAPVTSARVLLGTEYAILAGREKMLDACARAYARLVATENLEEARIRLARVLTRLGRYEEALAAAGPVAARPGDPVSHYLAALVQSAAYLAAGRGANAAEAARAAMADYPGCAAPRVALSCALRAAGRAEESRAVMADTWSSATEDGCRHDPWWGYYEGQPSRPRDMTVAMEREMRR